MPEAFEEVVARHKDVDPFLLKKWERIFNAFFDRNASSAVDWGDFYLVVRQVRDIYGAESNQMGYARKSMKALWDGLCKIADTNHDDMISLDEWIVLLKGVDPKQEPKWFNEYLTFMFKLFDVSADGKMDLSEYTDGMRTYGFDTEDAHDAFAKFAVNGSGNQVDSIDFLAWKKLFQDYFYSTDVNAVGNHVFDDGVMDLAEYTDGMTTYGFTSAQSHEAFHMFAVDKKGQPVKTVDPKRWREYFHEYYFSTDKKALGNHLFGKLDV